MIQVIFGKDTDERGDHWPSYHFGMNAISWIMAQVRHFQLSMCSPTGLVIFGAWKQTFGEIAQLRDKSRNWTRDQGSPNLGALTWSPDLQALSHP